MEWKHCLKEIVQHCGNWCSFVSFSFTSSPPFCKSQRLTWVKTQSAWWCNHSAVWKTSTKFVTVFPIPIGSLEGTNTTNGHDLPPFQETAIPSLLWRIWRLIENFPNSCFYRLTTLFTLLFENNVLFIMMLSKQLYSAFMWLSLYSCEQSFGFKIV